MVLSMDLGQTLTTILLIHKMNADIGIDEVELNFVVNAGNVSGEIHFDNNWNDRTQGDDGNGIEQAHFTYSFDNGLSAQIGVFGSNLGFEREDPAGLYTHSRSRATMTGNHQIPW